jgi:hypothetical protein
MEETMEEQERVYAELSIQSDILTPDEITSILGISADDAWVKGDLMPSRKVARRYPHHGWSIKMSLPEEATMEDHVQGLLQRLEPVKDKVKQDSKPQISQT